MLCYKSGWPNNIPLFSLSLDWLCHVNCQLTKSVWWYLKDTQIVMNVYDGHKLRKWLLLHVAKLLVWGSNVCQSQYVEEDS